MNIYAIRQDGFKYQELDLRVNDFIDHFPEGTEYMQAQKFSLNNIAMSAFWPSMKTGFSKIEDGENHIPDITDWIDATLVLSPDAYRYTKTFMEPFGEFLPIHIDGKTHQIFNCLTTAETDSAKCTEDKLVFDEKSVGEKLLFKSPDQHCLDVFCTDRFKDLVESYGLKGLVFDSALSGPFDRDGNKL